MAASVMEQYVDKITKIINDANASIDIAKDARSKDQKHKDAYNSVISTIEKDATREVELETKKMLKALLNPISSE